MLRLSMDGLTEISNYGMYDYFRDQYSNIDIGANQGVLIGGWDIHNKQYVLSAQTAFNSSIDDYSTLSFDEDINGWTSFFSYKPDSMLSLKSDFYSLKNGVLWKHYDSSVNRGNFYGWNNNTSVQFIFNPKVSMTKVFKTINYEGSNGWQINNFVSSETGFDTINGWSTDTTALIYSYDGGKYVQDGVTYRAGFDRKENKYVANLVNNTQARDGEIVWGDSMSGIKGFFATVSISTDYVVDSANGNIISGTNPGGAKELFAVSSIYSESSY